MPGELPPASAARDFIVGRAGQVRQTLGGSVGSTVFDEVQCRRRLRALQSTWVNHPDRGVREVVSAAYGSHVALLERTYAGDVHAYLASCLATHQVFLL